MNLGLLLLTVIFSVLLLYANVIQRIYVLTSFQRVPRRVHIFLPLRLKIVLFCLERNEKPFPSGRSIILGKVVSEWLCGEHNKSSVTFCTTPLLCSERLSLFKYFGV